jgi:hypothetical protein
LRAALVRGYRSVDAPANRLAVVPGTGTSKGDSSGNPNPSARHQVCVATHRTDEGAMEFITTGTESKATGRLTRSFVAVSGDQQREELLDVLLADEHDYGVVFVESIARSYSRIKQIVPDVVIVYCAMDDLAACQLLSMLKLDAELSRIRVVTCANAASNDESPDFFSEMVEPEPVVTVPVQMN